MTLRDVTNSSAQNICIYCYWSRFLLYGRYIRAVCTGRMYGCQKCTRIYGPYIRAVEPKSIANNAFSVRAVYTGRIYGWPVRTTRTYGRTYGPYVRAVCTGVKTAPVYTGRKYGPYIRVLGKHYPYIIAVLYGPYIRAVYTGDRYALPVNTGRKYGPCIRVSKIHPYIRAVNTARIYGPYLRRKFYG